MIERMNKSIVNKSQRKVFSLISVPCAQVVEKQCILYQLIFIKDMVCLFESVENGVRFFTRQTMMEIYVYSKKNSQLI